MHHPDVGAHLLDLGQEMAGDQHGGPVIGQGPDEVANLPGALWVEAVGRLVENEQLTWREQRSRDRQPLSHALGVCAVPLVSRCEQPHAVECAIDAHLGGARIGMTVNGIQP